MGLMSPGGGADDRENPGCLKRESSSLTREAMAAGLRSSVSPGGTMLHWLPDFLIGIVNVLVAGRKPKSLFLMMGPAECAAGGVAMLRRELCRLCGNVGIGVVENTERR